ncbi:MAG TPA: ABC transporter ATP-binding protein [Verrucomicrobiae bacterium]|nr:ABC transporter ATP-binding protein [Verrucomicrobiae bacterium]
MSSEEPAKAKVKPRSLLGVLVFLRKYPTQVALSVLLLLVNIAIEMSLPQIIGAVITQLRDHVDRGTHPDLAAFVTLFVALVLIRAGNGFILGPIRNRVVQRTLGDIRAAIYDSIQRLAFRYHDKARTGELISRSTSDIFRLQDFFFACLFLSVDIVVSLIVTVSLIFAISPLLALLALLTLGPTIGLIAFYASRLQPQWRKVDDLHGAMTTVIQENIAGVRVVKAFARESAEVARFRIRKDAFLTTLMQTVNYWAARVPFAQFIFGLSLPLILWVGGRLVIAGALPIGDLAKVVLYVMAIGHRMGMVGQFTNIIQHASASAERVLEVIREPQIIKSGERHLPDPSPVLPTDSAFVRAANQTEIGNRVELPVGPPLHAPRPLTPSFSPNGGEGGRRPGEGANSGSMGARTAGERAPMRCGRVAFDHVSFHYHDDKASLIDVSFEARPGQTVAIVGPTGSGKTTLVNLIPRFYDTSSGSVLVDAVDVRELKLGQLRRSVSVIFQETFLFSASAAENIAYGKPAAPREDIERAARAAQAHEFIMELESGYDTVIGERGVSLSGGQRQRIAIARAFLMDPRILILDDATASVDSGTERLVQEAMRRLCEGRTTFVIAHRFSTVRSADQILVLKEGRIVERGTHDELVSRSGFYCEIFEKQIKT